jgi:hypothetical protein
MQGTGCCRLPPAVRVAYALLNLGYDIHRLSLIEDIHFSYVIFSPRRAKK